MANDTPTAVPVPGPGSAPPTPAEALATAKQVEELADPLSAPSVAGNAAKHPLLSFAGVRNLATTALDPTAPPRIPFGSRTLRVFLHATFRSFCTGNTQATPASYRAKC